MYIEYDSNFPSSSKGQQVQSVWQVAGSYNLRARYKKIITQQQPWNNKAKYLLQGMCTAEIKCTLQTHSLHKWIIKMVKFLKLFCWKSCYCGKYLDYFSGISPKVLKVPFFHLTKKILMLIIGRYYKTSS